MRLRKPEAARVLCWIALVLLAGASSCAHAPADTPRFVYLTFGQEDTSRSIVVNHHTPPAMKSVEVRYDTEARGGAPDAYRQRKGGDVAPRMGWLPRRVHHVELTGLAPDTRYFFIVGNEDGGFSKERSFRTLPDDGRPLRFIVGGDMGTSKHVAPLLAAAAAQSPRVAVLGGDIAYGNGYRHNWDVWDAWLKNWQEQMVTPEGLTVPIVMAIGNHEVTGGFIRLAHDAPFYLHYFRQAPKSRTWFARRLGAHATMLLLDTGHLAEFEGKQARWIEQTLQRTSKEPFTFAAYHIPLYPAHRDPEGRDSVRGRKTWAPLFDAHRLTVAFEHHDHAYKRTHPLRDGARAEGDSFGTVYLGDGCFGVDPRDTLPDRWYLAKVESRRHFWRVDLDETGARFRAVDSKGEVFDDYRAPPRRAR